MEQFVSQEPRSYSLHFDLISGPKSYGDFRETDPRAQFLKADEC